MQGDIKEAIKDLKEEIKDFENEIKERKSQISFLKSLDTTTKIDESKWHQICDTSMCCNNIMSVLLNIIFPEANNIKIGANYVSFNLYGFDCAIPTFHGNYIEVDTHWYNDKMSSSSACISEPTINLSPRAIRMQHYFEALDNHASWEILFDYLTDLKEFKKWVKFILWFGFYKWRNPHRDMWERDYQLSCADFIKRLNKYLILRREQYMQSVLMKEKLLPKLYTFTKEVRSSSAYTETPPTILDREKLS